ncbi:hypothetical protein [Mycobacteroides abscessus]|uniref:Uncharacterized protein n=1 Tax=Mycobacteroides abscessus TaxID=36809 RepID=A0A0U0ZR48_9MYCO|nr:hypothetical protein [Mycobacteroides abscessus]CPV65959.1 Uncharacterised protein [Mycobacteroides abscessus]
MTDIAAWGCLIFGVLLTVSEVRTRWRRTAYIDEAKAVEHPPVFPPAGATVGADEVIHTVSTLTYLKERLEIGYPRARCGEPLWTIAAVGQQDAHPPAGPPADGFDCPLCHSGAPQQLLVRGHYFGRR